MLKKIIEFKRCQKTYKLACLHAFLSNNLWLLRGYMNQLQGPTIKNIKIDYLFQQADNFCFQSVK